MELGINTGLNCNKKNNINFGMAVKFEDGAYDVIKRQAAKLSTSARNNFIQSLKEISSCEEQNPVDILIKKASKRQALKAEVVDTETGDFEPLETSIYSQPLFFKNGKLKFLRKALDKAREVDSLNRQVAELKNATNQIDEAGSKMDVEA